MPRSLRLALAAALAGPATPVPLVAQTAPAAALPTIEEKTAGLERRDGLLPVYWDAPAGRVWLEVPRPGEAYLHVTSLPWGMGSNDIGLDRGQLGAERLVRFERAGPKLLLVQPNLAFRAESPSAAERRAVEESFARSVLWGFTVAAQTGERLLVDATDFVVRDAHGVVDALHRARQGDFKLDPARSAPHPGVLKAFPRNTELEATLTFAGDAPGRFVRDVTPAPTAITVRQRQSFVALPPRGYEPRAADPRAGYVGIEYRDHAAPFTAPMTRRLIARHRLEPLDPGQRRGRPTQPIVYWLDPGTPEPVRTAVLEGARWWAQAFEAAGWVDAFRVEVLPDTADPLDARYHVIQWVHRATRGWSYGATITDPRTGEIIKGHVTLGSLRVRQDYLLAEGLLAPYRQGDERAPEAERMALARLRQLSAHEVGHTLGLQHNYVGSTAGRASVMDYPHPLVTLRGGVPVLDAAYREGIGEWDKVAIAWGYGRDGSEAALDRLLADARARGITFLTDQDARPEGGAHPAAHLWDNGTDPADELDRMMAVRAAALARFGEGVIRRRTPLATMEEALVPLYLHHRYQVEAAVKLVAGQGYTYALRGDGQVPVTPVPAARQRAALRSLLSTVTPDALALPRGVVDRLPPRPAGFDAHRELFPRRTGLVFDALTPAEGAAAVVLGLLLHPERASRLVQQHALDPAQPGLAEVLDATAAAVWGAGAGDGYRRELGRTVEREWVRQLMRLGVHPDAPGAHGLALAALRAVQARAAAQAGGDEATDRAHGALLRDAIARYLADPPKPADLPPAAGVPPGSPIGWDEAVE